MNTSAFIHSRRAASFCIFAMHLWSLSLSAQTAKDMCDPGLKPRSDGEIGYRARGDRCEGLYVQEVSGDALEVVSFTWDFQNLPFKQGSPLTLAWPPATNADVRLRASGLKRELYYRMDSLLPAGTTSYKWPSDILAHLGLSEDNIGILCWTDTAFDASKNRLYLPIQLHQPVAASAPVAEAYKIAIISNVELEEVYVSLYPVDRSGHKGKAIRSSKKLDQGFYPADRPIYFRILFSELAGAGADVYALSIGAELKNGDPRNAPEFLFYHPHAGPGTTGKKGDR